MQCYKEKDSKKEEEIMEQLTSYTNKYGEDMEIAECGIEMITRKTPITAFKTDIG